jgi:hypothetical protein
MISGTQRLVVLGLIGCLAGLEAAVQIPPNPLRPGADAARDVDGGPCPRLDGPGDPVSAVGLTEEVDPSHAPSPHNDSERLLFRQVYETLVRTDCDLTVHPGLAASWRLDAAGTNWIVTLRRDARFTDGTPVTARDVITCWTRGGSALHPDVARFIQSATALDDLTLSIALRYPIPQRGDLAVAPDSLAQPALAVARFTSESPWPLGTRDRRLDPPAAAASGRTTISLVPATPASAAATSAPTSAAVPRDEITILRFVVSPNRDARDLLDQGVDLIVTRDPNTLAYATVLAQFDSLPLPWLRSYVFVSREGAATTLAPEARQALAGDAVPGEARGSAYDWRATVDQCTAKPPDAGARPQTLVAVTQARIAYDQADPVARALAERFAALSSVRPADGNRILDVLIPESRPRKLQTDPLRAPELSSALTRGADAGFVIALDHSMGCADIATLQERAPWLTAQAIVPLVDTRRRAVVRRGRSHITLEWDGSVLVYGPVQTQ